MIVLVKFLQTGSFNNGMFKSLDLDKILHLQILRLRNTCELNATTPENPQPDQPYFIARRKREYELQSIVNDLQQLKQGKKDSICEITDTGAHPVK